MISKWQIPLWERFWHTRQQNRLPHALLFIGMTGIGKKQFAEILAQAVLCKQVLPDGFACGECHACHLMQAHSHPDFVVITPAEKKQTITVDQIREVVTFVNETPLQNGYRVIIIHPAAAMNTNAANALLKTLEEPTPQTLFILINDESMRLPATVISRCQRVVFTQPMTEISLIPEVSTLRQEVYEGLNALTARTVDPLQLAAKWQNSDILAIIDLLGSWVQDLLRFKLTTDISYLRNNDYGSAITHLSPSLTRANLLAYVDCLQQARTETLATVNLNKQLLLEKLFIRWTQYVSS
jgi:DNA polymerase-3 subunit delta'